MADLFGIPRQRIPVAVAMVLLLAFSLSWLQGRFDSTDVKKGITMALQYRPPGGASTVFEALAARGEGDPACDGKVVSTLLGDVDVRCSTPKQPAVEYEFRVLLDNKRPPRPANAQAEALFSAIVRK
jgi:hypothetical protein